MLSILRGLFGKEPLDKAPKRVNAAGLKDLRQRFDNEQAEHDLSKDEVWERIGSEVNVADAAKVEKLTAKLPVVHHYHPDNVPPRYITPEFELLAKHIAERDCGGEPYVLSEQSLTQLAQYIEAKSGAQRVSRIAGARRWDWAQPLAVRKPEYTSRMILESVRNFGHRIFHNAATEFELSFEFLENGLNGPDGYLHGVISAVSEEEGKVLRAKRQARKVPHSDDTSKPPF